MPDSRRTLKRRPFIALSADYFDDPDVAAAGHLPALLYLHLACRIRQLHTDGWIHENQVIRLGFPHWRTHLRALVAIGLVTEHTDANSNPAWYLPAYLKWNPSEQDWQRREHEGTLGACKRHHPDPCQRTRCQEAAAWIAAYG